MYATSSIFFRASKISFPIRLLEIVCLFEAQEFSKSRTIWSILSRSMSRLLQALRMEFSILYRLYNSLLPSLFSTKNFGNSIRSNVVNLWKQFSHSRFLFTSFPHSTTRLSSTRVFSFLHFGQNITDY